MSYSPAPGSVAARVLGYLETLERGAELSTSQLAEALGVDAAGIPAQMQVALREGFLFSRQKGGHIRSPRFWSLVDHRSVPPVRPVLDAVAPADARASGGAASGRMRVALWSDGTLQISRADGSSVLFDAAETRALVAYLDRVLLERGGE